ncbi:MAG TPA: class I SAM-dependent methyltransferase [Polyangiaceae bacterium]|nr:class I SAM-dependent methyltransferase [Polyangiaceae bacterium]
MVKPVVWVGYTTRYREGGPRFRQAAHTLAAELRERAPDAEVRLTRVESKREFLQEMAELAPGSLAQLHLVAHGGMYGPMFGSRQWPEQFSRHEWSLTRLPFARGGQAFFHTCRSARWFAPYFAETFGVEAHGYYWYTTFSRSRHRFAWVPPTHPADAPLYVFGCKGRKSHGWLGAVGKYSGNAVPEVMRSYRPEARSAAGYDAVAELYDTAFQDIRVRADEWRWLKARLESSPPLSIVDLGCGNGALLCQLAPELARGIGLDASSEMVARARSNARVRGWAPRLHFDTLTGPSLPVPDQSVDRVVSLLSFRYLDWDPIVKEVRRVLRPGGRLLVIDMVQSPLRVWQAPALLHSKWRTLAAAHRFAPYRRALGRLLADPGWAKMLESHPMRAEHELAWYLGSRFPKGRMELLNVGFKSKILAFDSGPIHPVGRAQGRE